MGSAQKREFSDFPTWVELLVDHADMCKEFGL